MPRTSMDTIREKARTCENRGLLTRKPLYLLARTAHRVKAENESLAVYRGRIGLGRYPVGRLARIVCSQHVDWSGGALSLCFAHEIPILFVDLRGRPLGSCLPAQLRSAPLDELMDGLTAESGWKRHYSNFMRHIRGRLLRRHARELAEAGNSLDEAEWSLWMRTFVHQDQLPVELDYDISGVLRGLVEMYLRYAGVHTRYWTHGGEALDLAGDMTRIIQGWMLMNAGLLLLRNARAASAIRLVESGTGEVERLVRWILDALRRCLAARSGQWL